MHADRPTTPDSRTAADRCRSIELLVLDVDGVLTDGGIQIDGEGCETKRFHVRDGAGIAFWRSQGKRASILSGRSAAAVEIRAAELGIDPVLQGIQDKGQALLDLIERFGLHAEQVAFIGDDLPDIPALALAGLAVCPADAAAEVRDRVHWVASTTGGQGVVRETIEQILKCQGVWNQVLSRYHVAV